MNQKMNQKMMIDGEDDEEFYPPESFFVDDRYEAEINKSCTELQKAYIYIWMYLPVYIYYEKD